MTWTTKRFAPLLALALLAGELHAQGPQRGPSAEETTVEAAGDALREIMAIPLKGIPESLLADAQGIAIIPGMVKGGFIIGVRHGNGVALARNADGAWTAPTFISVTGGSVGWQAGVQATDVVIVFRNRKGIDGLARGKFTLGADASVAAGPVGRQASAATDVQLKAEMLSYSRSRGLFLGIALDGAAMQIDHRANAEYYALRPGQPEGSVPASAMKLVEQVAGYAGGRHKMAVNLKDLPPAPPLASQVETLRAHLAESSARLGKQLDPQWQQFLALPAEAYMEGKAPAKDALERSLANYKTAATDARYQTLASRPEFQDAYATLVRYRAALEESMANTLKLPPPPK